MTPKIKYKSKENKYYEVPGNIIIPGEILQIPQIEAEKYDGFHIYDLKTGEKKVISNYYLCYDSSHKTGK
jgi:hypothetical protein